MITKQFIRILFNIESLPKSKFLSILIWLQQFKGKHQFFGFLKPFAHSNLLFYTTKRSGRTLQFLKITDWWQNEKDVVFYYYQTKMQSKYWHKVQKYAIPVLSSSFNNTATDLKVFFTLNHNRNAMLSNPQATLGFNLKIFSNCTVVKPSIKSALVFLRATKLESSQLLNSTG